MLRYFLSYFLFFIYALYPSVSCAQQQRSIDSLLVLLKKDREDTSKAVHLYKLCQEHLISNKYDTALRYGTAALQLSKQLDFKPGIAMSYNNIGTCLYEQGNYSEAVKNYFVALEIRETLGDQRGMASLYNNIGNVYAAQDNYAEALKNYLLVLEIANEIGDKESSSLAHNNMGTIYMFQNNYPEAMNNYFSALRISEERGDKLSVTILYNNIGNLYAEQGNYPEALKNTFAALNMANAMDDKQSIAFAYGSIGGVYAKQNNVKDAVEYFNKELAIAKEIGNTNLIKNSYEGLADVYGKNKHHSLTDAVKALDYYKEFIVYRDSLINEESTKKIAELQIKYETEKKQKEIDAQSHQLTEQELLLSRNRLLILFLSIGLLLIFVLGWATFSRYKIKKESHIKSEMLRHQEDLTKAIIETQEKERKRIAQDLHDGIGHKLTTLKFNLEKISGYNSSASIEEKNIFHQTESILDETHKEVRALSHSMMPKALQVRELADAVSDLADQTFANSTLKYSLKNDFPVGLPENIQICLYRVLQELLNNILKHAQATQAAIQIFQNKSTVIMIVEDDGIGISEKTNIQSGIGLNNIRARVNALNGVFTIEPGPVKGTVATVRIPLSQL